MPHLYPFLSSKRPYLQLFQQLQTLLHDKKKVIYLFSVTSPNIFGSNIEYNPKFLSKIKKALEFQCLYRSFYFHWPKQSG